MRTEDYDLMHALESDYWWFAGMRQVTNALLSRHISRAPGAILDVGCGTGINLLFMLQQFRPERIVGFDYSDTALDWCRETLKSAPSFSKSVVPQLTRGDVRKLPFADRNFDLITCLDVLDLFPPGQEDVQAMGEIHRVLRPGGLALIREPAYRWLLSSHDTLFETRHRYTTRELSDKMSSAGFRVAQTTYANTVLFPLALKQRLLRKMLGYASERTDTQPWPKSLEWLNGPFESCLRLEASLISSGLRFPYGLSAVCIGRRDS